MIFADYSVDEFGRMRGGRGQGRGHGRHGGHGRHHGRGGGGSSSGGGWSSGGDVTLVMGPALDLDEDALAEAAVRDLGFGAISLPDFEDDVSVDLEEDSSPLPEYRPVRRVPLDRVPTAFASPLAPVPVRPQSGAFSDRTRFGAVPTGMSAYPSSTPPPEWYGGEGGSPPPSTFVESLKVGAGIGAGLLLVGVAAVGLSRLVSGS